MPKKILIVDDEKTTLVLLNKILTEEGYEVAEASEGRAAIKKSQTFLPDLIIMDIVLPDMDGAESAQAIHNNPDTQDINILFFSGILTTDDKINVENLKIKAGNIEYEVIPKPVNREEILEKVKTFFP